MCDMSIGWFRSYLNRSLIVGILIGGPTWAGAQTTPPSRDADVDILRPLSPSIRLDEDNISDEFSITGDASPSDLDPLKATSPDRAPTAAPNAKPKATNPQVVNDPLSLQIDFAESALKLSHTLANLGRVISIYERGLANVCPKNKSRCDQFISRLLELDVGNVPALCQKFGLHSPECKEVIAAQELGWYDVDAARWRTVFGSDGGELDSSDLASAIESKRNKPQVDLLINAREELIRMSKRETAEELKLDKVLVEGLALTCASPKIIFLERTPSSPEARGLGTPSAFSSNRPGASATPSRLPSLLPPDPNPMDPDVSPGSSAFGSSVTPLAAATKAPPGNSTNPFDSVLSGLNALPTPMVTAQPTKTVQSRISAPLETRLRRIRLLGRECYDFVRVATAVRPAMVQARCALDGWYSPSCRGASPLGPNSGEKDGIDSF